jgi:chemotaxis protein methyltransferase CheR
MIDDQRPISIEVVAADKSVASKDAVSIGLVVTESVINALKHAYPDQDRPGKIVVEYEVNGQDWRLSVSDDGVGMRDSRPGAKRGGLGTTLINALSKQLQAQVEIESCGKGTTVSMMKATFDSEPAAEEMPEAPRDLQ